jgi:hyaluronoglucosaminidase
MASEDGAFLHRGVVEGFYGPPFAHADRMWLIERIGAWGMNRYLYAPKDDPLHRSRWREPYPEDGMREFGELVTRGEKAGVSVGFGVSPGLSIRYSSSEDVRALCGKLRAFAGIGARFFSLAVDDVPSRLVHEEDLRAFSSLAEAHVALAHAIAEAVPVGSTLWVVPTDYLGVKPTDYLEEMGAALDPAIEVGWTGRTVVSPEVRLEEAQARARTLRRRLLMWDNVPVADGPMRPMLHLGPYAGRAPELPDCLSGVLLNPMQQARASGVALHTAAAYLADPVRYRPEQAWARALEELGAGAEDAFALFARAHRFSPLWPHDRDSELEDAFATLASALEAGEDLWPYLAELARRVEARATVADRLRSGLGDRGLRDELEPWLAAHATETRRLQAAVEALRGLLGGRESMDRLRAFMSLQARLTRDPLPAKASYGPRRVLYPQLVSLRDDGARLGGDPALFRDQNLVDEILEFVEELGLFIASGEGEL